MKNENFKNLLSLSTPEDIPDLLNKIRSHYDQIQSYQRGTFNQLVAEFRDHPNNFQFSTWKSRLRVFVSGLDFEIENAIQTNSSVVIGNGNFISQGNNNATIINNFSGGSNYGQDREIEGIRKAIELLIEKQNFLLGDYHTSSGQYKFSLQKELENIELELEKYRSKISQYEGATSKELLTLVSLHIEKTPKQLTTLSSSRPSRKKETVFGSLEDKVKQLESEINNPTSEIVVDLAIQFCKEFRGTLNENNDTFDRILKLEGKLNAAQIKLERTGEVSIYDDINEIAKKVVKLFQKNNEIVPKKDSINYEETLEGLKSKLQKRQQDQETKDWLEATNSAILNLPKLNQASREKAIAFKNSLDDFIVKANHFTSGGAKIGFDFDSI